MSGKTKHFKIIKQAPGINQDTQDPARFLSVPHEISQEDLSSKVIHVNKYDILGNME